MASATITPATITAVAGPARGRTAAVKCVAGLSCRAGKRVPGLGLPVGSNSHAFVRLGKSFRVSSKGGRGRRGGGGGVMSTTCNAAAEIFRIAAIMNGLVIVGVAVGFVLLGIESTVEETE